MNTFRMSSRIVIFLVVLGSAVAQQEPTFNAQANVVLVPTLVTDSTGNIVYGLQARDFVIEDDGIEQVAHLDEAADDAPVSVVIAVQCGRRAWREFSRIQGLAAMLEPVLSRSDTESALVFFDSKLTLARDFTHNAQAVEDDLKNLRAGDNGAAILDAVAYSVRLLNQRPEERQRVLLLISENRDHGSRFAKLDEVVKLIGLANVAIYVLPFSPSLSQTLDTERGSLLARSAMKKNVSKAIASMSGGEYQLFASRKGFETRMNSFSNHLQNRYLLSFQPKSPRPGLHQIRVRLKDPERGGKVLFRSNYWAEGVSQ
jgi:VWFA-related protein